MEFQIGQIRVNFDLVKLMCGDCLTLELEGQLSDKIAINLYVDYAPKAETKLFIKGQITEVKSEEKSTNS